MVTVFCFGVNFLIFYSISSIFLDVYAKNNEKKQLAVELYDLKEENERLKVEVRKLNNSEYVARYVREKYFYSGKNEYILRMK